MAIVRELRPCKFDMGDGETHNGLFHGWFEERRIINPSNIKGGHNGGVIQYCVGLVEGEDGTMHKLDYDEIRFTDGKLK